MTTSLYFHIPFCKHRCAYCDFNTYAGQDDSIPPYINALQGEIRILGAFSPRVQIGTIFFGGGTPSLVSASHYAEIFECIYQNFDVSPAAEISLEANPGTVTPQYLRDLHSIGFNRISFGVQSADPNELRMLERIHSYSDVVDSVKWSREAGFDNLNLDLIYGLPEQTLERWQNTVSLISGLHPQHISAYALTLEHGTPFGRWAQKGLLPIPDPDLAADQYEWIAQFLDQLGYEQYEISNWSKPGYQCKHNLQYWRNLDYLGLGAGAHGYSGGYRYSNALRIKTYIDRIATSTASDFPYPLTAAVVNNHKNSVREDMQETLFTGLRLTAEGISAQAFRKRFDVDVVTIFGDEIQKSTQNGLLEWAGDTLRLTSRGRLLGNQVFMQFVD